MNDRVRPHGVVLSSIRSPLLFFSAFLALSAAHSIEARPLLAQKTDTVVVRNGDVMTGEIKEYLRDDGHELFLQHLRELRSQKLAETYGRGG